MPFELHFECGGGELLDVSILDELEKYSHSNNFNTIIFNNNFNQSIPKLPKFIKHIELGYDFKEDISNIGENIESIKFTVEKFNYNLKTFPKQLKELKIICHNILSQIEYIHPVLEKLIIESANFNEQVIINNTNIYSLSISSEIFNQSLQYLSKNLKYLEINSIHFNSPVNNLPPYLEFLKISSSNFNHELDNLPLELNTLILEINNAFTKPLINLPQKLEVFTLNLGWFYNDNFVYKHSLENLPLNIKTMTLSNYWGNMNNINDNVVKLDVWFPTSKSAEARTYIQHWKKFPNSLKILNVNKEISRINKKHNMIDIITSNIQCNGICINDILM